MQASPLPFAGSALFFRTFDEAMALVQETSAYLDGQGRDDSRELPRDAALAYAAESMRLTTRLMQISSWLLTQRAIYKGQLDPERSRGAKHRLPKPRPGAPVMASDAALPPRLRDIVMRSLALYERVRRLDEQLGSDRTRSFQAESPITTQLQQIERAFRSAG